VEGGAYAFVCIHLPCVCDQLIFSPAVSGFGDPQV